ncbi:MAG: hypothetical protein ACLPXZ_03790 [Mycobacterium sp.]
MSEAAHVEVDLDGHRHRLRWPHGQALIDLLLDAGPDMPGRARAGKGTADRA